MYIRIYELYVDQLELDPDSVAKMGVVRLSMMAPIIKDMTREEAVQKLEDTKDMRYGEFVREVKQGTNKEGKPTVYWSNEYNKWVVNYYQNNTELISLGDFTPNGDFKGKEE